MLPPKLRPIYNHPAGKEITLLLFDKHASQSLSNYCIILILKHLLLMFSIVSSPYYLCSVIDVIYHAVIQWPQKEFGAHANISC